MPTVNRPLRIQAKGHKKGIGGRRKTFSGDKIYQSDGGKGPKVRYTVPLFPAPTQTVSLPDINAIKLLSPIPGNAGNGLVPGSTALDMATIRSVSSGYGSCWSGATEKVGSVSVDSTIVIPYSSLGALDPRSPLSPITKVASQSPASPVTVKTDRVIETKCVTTVYQLLSRGLKLIIPSIMEEIHNISQSGSIIAYCEMRWSIPNKQRDPNDEIKLKSHLLQALLWNNERVWNETGKSHKGSITEESVSIKRQVQAGAYRRYYGDVLSMAHQEAIKEHSSWWKVDTKSQLTNDIQWPAIGSLTEVSILMLNVICIHVVH